MVGKIKRSKRVTTRRIRVEKIFDDHPPSAKWPRGRLKYTSGRGTLEFLANRVEKRGAEREKEREKRESGFFSWDGDDRNFFFSFFLSFAFNRCIRRSNLSSREKRVIPGQRVQLKSL